MNESPHVHQPLLPLIRSSWLPLPSDILQQQAIAIDMAPAYIAAVTENLPKAVIVFDHFHVVKLYNDRLSDFHRKLFHPIKNEQQKQVIKGTRWLLMKNPENLNRDQSESDRLEAALELNCPPWLPSIT